jgi:phenylacetate-CoA ligase
VQTSDLRWDFHSVADDAADDGAIQPSLARMLGDGARVVAFRRRFITPDASSKFMLKKLLDRQ